MTQRIFTAPHEHLIPYVSLVVHKRCVYWPNLSQVLKI